MVAKASSKSPSVRTTIPEFIAKQLGIKPGDVLDWELTLDRAVKTVKVRKLE